MNVFLGFDRLAANFGPGKVAVALATGLRSQGHDVTVFVEEPLEPDNQYAAALEAVGARVIAPGRLAAWSARAMRREAVQLALLLPLRLALTLVDSALRRRSFARAWRGVAGRLNRHLSHGPIGRPLRWANRRQLSHAHRQRNADVLHLITGVGSAFEWAVQNGVPIVYQENSVPTAALGVDWWADVVRYVDRIALVVSVCEAAEPAIRGVLGYRGPVAVMRPKIADPLAGRIAAEKRESDPSSGCIIGCLARLSASKGVDLLIRALPTIRQNSTTAVQLRIAGSGPEREALEGLARDLGIDAQVRFLGGCGQREIDAFWSDIDIFALPSRWEGLPLVIVEAMAYGKPVVATSVGGVPEVVRDRETGILVPTDRVEPLAEALASLIGSEPTRAALGRSGRARFLAEFRADDGVDHWIELYRGAAHRPPSAIRNLKR